MILNLFLRFLLHTWVVATNSDIQTPGFLSRLGGSFLTLIWGWVFIVFVLIFLTVLPCSWEKTLTAIHNDVVRSTSYCRIVKPLEDVFFATSNQNIPVATGTALNFDAKSLATDPRFQKILQDPEIQDEIKAHDIVKLMRNPKMLALTQQIINDPETMKKVLAIYKSQMQPQVPPATPESSQQ